MTRNRKPLLFPVLLVLFEISTYLSNDMYLPALPQMKIDLALSSAHAQFTLTTWFLGFASTPLIFGALSDRYGRRPVLLLGGLFYTLASAVCAMTGDIVTLLIARFIQGGMICAATVVGYAAIHELYEQKQAIRILALMASITILAPALGPLLGGIILLFSTWRGIFWVIAIGSALAILLLFQWMPESLPKNKRQSIHPISLLRHYYNVLTNKKFMVLASTLGFIFSGFIAWIAAGPLLVMESFQYSAIMFGVIQAVVFICYMIGNRLVKHLMEQIGINYLIDLGLAITLCGGLLSLLLTHFLPNSLYPFLSAMMIYAFGSALSFAPLNRTAVEACAEPMGVRMAIFSVLMSIYAVIGSGMASLFFNGAVSSLSYLMASAIIVSCCVKWIVA